MKLIPIFLLLLGACITIPKVRQADLNAWTGKPVTELLSHPHFSRMSFEQREITPSLKLYLYRDVVRYKEAVSCRGADGIANCEVTPAREAGCVNQFLVRGEIIESYTMTEVGGGGCSSTCAVRPLSSPCESGQ